MPPEEPPRVFKDVEAQGMQMNDFPKNTRKVG